MDVRATQCTAPQEADVSHLSVEQATILGTKLYYSAVPDRGVPFSSEKLREESSQQRPCVLLLFAGDIQDSPEAMIASGNERLAARYSLPATARALAEQCSNYNFAGDSVRRYVGVLVWAPKRMDALSRAFFDAACNVGFGVGHIWSVLTSVPEQWKIKFSQQNPEDCGLHVAGFSRGAVVLGHLLAEISSLVLLENGELGERDPILDWETGIEELPEFEPSYLISSSGRTCSLLSAQAGSIKAFASRLDAMTWVDAHRFITNPAVYNTALYDERSYIPSSVRLTVHTTPLMESRPWVLKQLRVFLKYVPNVAVHRHFTSSPPTIATHFDALTQIFSNADDE